MQNFDFSKKLFRMILVMFWRKPFGLGIVWMCLKSLQTSEHIFLAQRSILWQQPTNQAKFSSKMPFWYGKMTFLTKRPRGKQS